MFPRQSFITWLLAGVLSLVLIGTVGATVHTNYSGHKFYYYYPDSAQTNLVSLKQAMDTFLHKAGCPLFFTTFARFNDFDRLTKEKKPEFVLLPQWYLDENGSKLQFESLLFPVRNGQKSYKKVLLANKHSNISLATLTNKSLAMTSMGSNADSRLNEKLFSRLNMDIKKMNVVTTPKDSDALFALVLGQVDMALVGADNLERLAKLNPTATQLVRPLAETSPIPLPVICYRKGAVPQETLEQVRNIFLNSDRKRFKFMEMLQIDSWKSSIN